MSHAPFNLKVKKLGNVNINQPEAEEVLVYDGKNWSITKLNSLFPKHLYFYSSNPQEIYRDWTKINFDIEDYKDNIFEHFFESPEIKVKKTGWYRISLEVSLQKYIKQHPVYGNFWRRFDGDDKKHIMVGFLINGELQQNKTSGVYVGTEMTTTSINLLFELDENDTIEIVLKNENVATIKTIENASRLVLEELK